ncbi:MAG TPA: response regulator [Anaerolineales bacterium]|nr:response regulator [Anaerolineales bacterium]
MTYALIIDDVEEVTVNLSRMLELLGVECKAAFSVREAMLHLLDRPPDIIFLDIVMPGFDGFEVLAYLRREPRLENVPVCVVSTESQEETVKKARKLGVADYIVKPAGIEELEAALRSVKLLPRRRIV